MEMFVGACGCCFMVVVIGFFMVFSFLSYYILLISQPNILSLLSFLKHLVGNVLILV